MNQETTEVVTEATPEPQQTQQKVSFKVRVSCGCGFHKTGSSWASLIKLAENHVKQLAHTLEIHFEIRPKGR